ncbi:carboxypeptidase-like regulatory domain-containing protein [Leeuwenhoekiella parthenopeia]|uniref:Carboxypeptidase-like regulatory domain-containing protein n=1 Tax=Leeuwenhoekiella parthenopeia TaxID=2890320 RepID=A0ABS8GNR9_9FLAO|nr:carboxypeptidase-like regulatory domain-containing protein [Leeuwenhoekiella parthenopeia]MCC4211153.1 carboxypeptidase-like regulatory domain-containing protein [Leeuwenhoekiella parthenopeia]
MRYLIRVLGLCLSLSGFAQDRLSGYVYSAQDSTALADVSIYFDGTTLGTITNKDGHYSIAIQPGVKSALVISMLGYNPVYINNYQNISELPVVYLTESTEQLGEVFLETDPWSREHKMREFKREFLGGTEVSKNVKILNEEVIKLHYSASKKRLVAWATKPIQIENKYLGYVIDYELQDFYIDYEKSLKSDLNLVYMVYYAGTSFFRELKPKVPRRFKKHRDEAFEGSTLHFMRSLANQKLGEHGFRIFHKSFEVAPYQFFKLQQGEENIHVEQTAEQLSILFDNDQQSSITAKVPFQIDKFGNHFPPSGIIIGGAMGRRRLAMMLPQNYKLQP